MSEDKATAPNGAQANGAAKGGKERSPNYPAMTLSDAIERVGALYEVEKRTTVTPETAAKALNFGGMSGAARTVIASLRQYGLIENNEHGVRVSDLAMEILHQPPGSPERAIALTTAAKKPPLIAELLGTHAEASDEAIRSHLILRKKFSSDGAGRFIPAFRDALRFAQAGGQGYIAPEGGKGSGHGENPIPPKDKLNPPPRDKGERMEFTWPLSGDVVATLTVSRQIDADDVDTLNDYFEIAKKALLKAARASAAAKAPSAQSDASA